MTVQPDLKRYRVLTYSALSMFRNCRKKYQLRYVIGLVRIGATPMPLLFGSAIHKALEAWDGYGDAEEAFKSFAGLPGEETIRGQAMINGYIERYPTLEYDFVEVEQEGIAPIINPATHRESRSFVLAWKKDGIVHRNGSYYIWENKTTDKTTGAYLDRLWTDFQIKLYSNPLYNDFPIKGVIYNVLQKTRIRLKKKQSEDDYFHELLEIYRQPEMFTREKLFFTPEEHQRLDEEIWELTQQILDCQRRDYWYQNTSNCFHWNRECPYYKLCSSNENPLILENHYEYRAPHEELAIGKEHHAANQKV